EFLRKKGLAGVEKKAGRIAAEGLVANLVSEDLKTAVSVEVNSETDFVAKNEKFRTYVEEVACQALNSDAKDMEAFAAEKWALDPSMTVQEKLASMIAVIGENMRIRRFEKVTVDNGFITSYVHGGGKIGVLVKVESDTVNDALKEMAFNVAMQVAALRPMFCKREDVPGDFIEKETEILKAQIENDPKEAAKPEQVKMGMIKGRINKELKEICLMDQEYTFSAEGKETVAQYVENTAKACGAKAKVVSFVRFETGEGLEKREEDFAAEVAKQMNK
ncbi:MAG: elongation factor Ts, partial [Lachnospiraceae bacterium]|nr:elongation factor Ts [Lachnospiraceae bacterium]